MAKPAGAMCNLGCDYCYYQHNADGTSQLMSDDLLEKFIHDYIEAQAMPQVLFTWHGGEPMMRGLEFYKKIIRLESKHSHGKHIDNVIQTNGMFMTDEWAEFLHDNGWLVGISIDGPQEFHDAFRKDKGGKASFQRVINAIEMLRQHDVMWNAMAVVHSINVKHPVETYNFFKEIDARYIQFTPLVTPKCDATITAKEWGDFLCSVFDEWVKEDVGEYFVEIFDATLANWVGETPGICCFSPYCGQAGVIEHDGSVYSCDHFVSPRHKLGNIREHTFIEMMFGEQQRNFGRSKRTTLPRKCRECKYLFACNGECPKNRLSLTDEGEPGLNYLCEGYYKYFEHVAPFMEAKARRMAIGKSD